MIELKYYKNIHAKISNTKNSVITLKDACIYADKNNNRYCFVSFKNKQSDPLFSILFHVKQYDQTGQFLKEGKFYLPNCYHPRGEFEIDEPFQVEKECDAVEIYIQRAIFKSRAFYADKFVSIKSVPSAFEPKQSVVIPESPNFVHKSIEPVVEMKQETKEESNAVEIEKSETDIEEIGLTASEPVQEVEEPIDKEEAGLAVPTEEVSTVAKDAYGSAKKVRDLNWIVPVAVGVVLIIFFIIVMSKITDIYRLEGILK